MGNPNRMLGTAEVLERLRHTAAWPCAKVVGRWVWVEFEQKPDKTTRDMLRELGFHWNRKRGAWQHPCGVFSHHGHGDPRFKYGSVPASELSEDLANVAM